DVDADFPRRSELRAHDAGQAEAHRAQPAGGDHLPRATPTIKLRRPHLMLTDAGRDHRFPAGLLVDLLDDVLRLGVLGIVEIFERVALLPRGDLRVPVLAIAE